MPVPYSYFLAVLSLFPRQKGNNVENNHMKQDVSFNVSSPLHVLPKCIVMCYVIIDPFLHLNNANKSMQS